MNGNLALQYENPLFSVAYPAASLDMEDVSTAKRSFREYREKGIVLEGNFEDDRWLLTDEYARKTVRFDLDAKSYRSHYQQYFGCSCTVFRNYFKAFCISLFGQRALGGLQGFANDIRKIVRTDPEEILDKGTDFRLNEPARCLEFLCLAVQGAEDESFGMLLDSLEMCAQFQNIRKGDQRELSQLDSYLLFNDILEDFWKNMPREDERLYYFPLYLWWEVTAIIPLRPREFLLTPRECLEKRDGQYYLTLRRNDIKGSGRQIRYRICEDYYETPCPVPDRLGAEIEWYLERTSGFADTDISSLFVTDTHYRKWGQKKHCNSRFLTYANLNTVLRYFYREVIERKYGMKVYYGQKDGYLDDNEIGFIHLGDSRHISLINFISEGGTPALAMFLAGHDSAQMSFHYYSNISRLVECMTYRQYRLVTQGAVSYQTSLRQAPLVSRQAVRLPDGGYCFSDRYPLHDYGDCMKSVGKDGEIARCTDCSFYRKPGRGYYQDDSTYRQNIEDAGRQLEEIVNAVRRGKGSKEDIGECLLKIKEASLSYQQFCRERMERKGENTDGKAKDH